MHLEPALAALAPTLVTPPPFSSADEGSDLDFLRGGKTVYGWPAAVAPRLETLAVAMDRKTTCSPMTSTEHTLLR